MHCIKQPIDPYSAQSTGISLVASQIYSVLWSTSSDTETTNPSILSVCVSFPVDTAAKWFIYNALIKIVS